MEETFFDKVKRIISEGGKLIITNRKGIELDITTECRGEVLSISTTEATYQDMLQRRDTQIKKLTLRNATLEDENNMLKKYKNLFDEITVRNQVYKNSPEEKLIDKLKASDIEEISSVLQHEGVEDLSGKFKLDEAIEKFKKRS